MAIETKPFDPADYLDSPADQADLLSDAVESADPRYIAYALGAVARARGGIGKPSRPRFRCPTAHLSGYIRFAGAGSGGLRMGVFGGDATGGEEGKKKALSPPSPEMGEGEKKALSLPSPAKAGEGKVVKPRFDGPSTDSGCSEPARARVKPRFDGPSTGSGCSEPAAARVKPRFDGFTAKKRRRFIATLAKTGCFSDAARAAGISRETARRWRNKDARFASLCAAAVDKAAGHMETLAWERGVTGIEEPIVHYGKVVGTRIKRSDSIFRMLLMASDKEKYGRMGAVERKAAEREMRARIEAEIRAEEVPIEQVQDEVLARLAALRRHREERGGGRG